MGAVVIFDFDKTIIECDSDDWVVDNFGLTQLFNVLIHTMPNSSLMDRMMEELHIKGKTIQDVAECLYNIPLSPNIISAIHLAYTSGCDLRIISDANTFFIETILARHGILHCFSEINTNSASVNEDGRLEIFPCYDFKSSCHKCNLCPLNLCKGIVIERIRESLPDKRFIYVGDGKNDYCPSLTLTEKDYVMPRKDFQLWNAISSNPVVVKAGVHEWNNGEELEINLTRLIKINHPRIFEGITRDGISEEFVFSDCKSQTVTVVARETLPKTVQVSCMNDIWL